MLAAAQGAEIEIRTTGEEEAAALTALVELIADRFGEPS
jgi:phosphotransferase system HPr-like phosphotransfer protein